MQVIQYYKYIIMLEWFPNISEMTTLLNLENNLKMCLNKYEPYFKSFPKLYCPNESLK